MSMKFFGLYTIFLYVKKGIFYLNIKVINFILVAGFVIYLFFLLHNSQLILSMYFVEMTI